MKYLLSIALTLCLSAAGFAEVVEFSLQSSDSGVVTDQHGGRPYHVFDTPEDEAIYITASDWEGGHDPTLPVKWPISDGFINWSVIQDPNGATGRPEVMTYNANGELAYLYLNVDTDEYEIHDSPELSDDTIKKLCYSEFKDSDSSLNFGNTGDPGRGLADRQNALITEFKLQRALDSGLAPDNLVSAKIEITIDDVVDMTLNGNNMALIPSKMFVNSFNADGILDRYENVQAAFDLIDHDNADNEVWLTLDNTETGWYVTDFTLSYYRLVAPGLDEPFTITIDVTDTFLNMLNEGSEYAGYVFSGSPDGDFTLASLDLVERDGRNYLPKLVITADIPELYADFDNNGVVNILDFSILSCSWSTQQGDETFNPVCDIYDPNDGKIDIGDLQLFVTQWLN